MARVPKESRSFTCTPRAHPLTGMNHTCRTWHSSHHSTIYTPRRRNVCLRRKSTSQYIGLIHVSDGIHCVIDVCLPSTVTLFECHHVQETIRERGK